MPRLGLNLVPMFHLQRLPIAAGAAVPLAMVQQLRICLCRQLEVGVRAHGMATDSLVPMHLVTVELVPRDLHWLSGLSQSHERQLVLTLHLVPQ